MEKDSKSKALLSGEFEDRYTFMNRMLYGEWNSPDVADLSDPTPEPLERDPLDEKTSS